MRDIKFETVTEYGRSVAPKPEWGDDETTADDLIENRLVMALEALAALQHENTRKPVSTPEIASLRRAIRTAAIFKMTLCAVEAEFLATVVQLAPKQADRIARAHRDRMEMSDGYSETLYVELMERGINAQQVIDEAMAKYGKEGDE